MKKILKELAIIITGYIIFFVYDYYNSNDKEWSWLVAAIIVLIVYPILKIIEHKKK